LITDLLALSTDLKKYTRFKVACLQYILQWCVYTLVGGPAGRLVLQPHDDAPPLLVPQHRQQQHDTASITILSIMILLVLEIMRDARWLWFLFCVAVVRCTRARST